MPMKLLSIIGCCYGMKIGLILAHGIQVKDITL